MSEARSARNEEDRASRRDVASTRSSPKPPPSESLLSYGSQRRRSRSPSDRSNRPDQSTHSFCVRGMVDSSDQSLSSYRSHDKDRRGYRRGDYGRSRSGTPHSESRSSEEQYSSDYESEDSMSGSGTASRSYEGRSSPSASHTSASYDDSDRRGPRYQGDVSAWGRTRMDINVQDTSASEDTLSSGLSPRGSEADKRAAFDQEAATRALAYNAGLYGRAQTMRREGTAPKTMGIADDLPNRFALEQLSALAGMANKVQAAIEHNRQVFAKRVRMEDKALLKKGFDAWRAARYGSIAKQQLLRRAIARLHRGLMARAFLAWKDKFHLVDKYLAMRRKVSATIRRGRMKRAFQEWRRLVHERWWKNQLAARDAQVHALERKVEGFERRPIVVLRRRKMFAIMEWWYWASEEQRRRRLRREKAANHWRNMSYIKAWNSWRQHTLEAVRRKNLIHKTALKIKNIHMVSSWNKWFEYVLVRRDKSAKRRKAAHVWKNMLTAKAWRCWWNWVEHKRQYKAIVQRWKHPLKGRALRGWYDRVQWAKRMRITVNKCLARMKNRPLCMAWEAWHEFIKVSQLEKLGKHMITKEELEKENVRLRRDNERFVRLIDSGEWGRGRVAELVSAGEILKGERDALLKLIQSLRREYESVQSAKVAQDDEIRGLRERMLLGGAARNRMLVKGASSYNATLRALKQDLVENAATSEALRRDPNLVFAVDQLSLNEVTVIPGGGDHADVHVRAVAAAPGTAAFARPLGAGTGLRHAPPSPGPVHPLRMPPGYGPSSASPSRMMGAATPAGRGPGLAIGATPGSSRPPTEREVYDRLNQYNDQQLAAIENAVQQQVARLGGRRPPGAAGPSRQPNLASSSPGRGYSGGEEY